MSLPVGMNEPFSLIHRYYETVCSGEEIMRRAANTDDPAKRLALVAISLITSNY